IERIMAIAEANAKKGINAGVNPFAPPPAEVAADDSGGGGGRRGGGGGGGGGGRARHRPAAGGMAPLAAGALAAKAAVAPPAWPIRSRRCCAVAPGWAVIPKKTGKMPNCRCRPSRIRRSRCYSVRACWHFS